MFARIARAADREDVIRDQEFNDLPRVGDQICFQHSPTHVENFEVTAVEHHCFEDDKAAMPILLVKPA